LFYHGGRIGIAGEKTSPWITFIIQSDSFKHFLVYGFLCLCKTSIKNTALAQFFRSGTDSVGEVARFFHLCFCSDNIICDFYLGDSYKASESKIDPIFLRSKFTEGNCFIGIDFFSAYIHSCPKKPDPYGSWSGKRDKTVLFLLCYWNHPYPHPVLPHAVKSIAKGMNNFV
jgi:hypothetical protein